MGFPLKVLLGLQALIIASWAIFSYGFVDLNLNFGQNKFILDLISSLQRITYYNRPISTAIFLLLLLSSYVIFILILIILKRGHGGWAFVKRATLVSTLILVFSYPFLSSDIFNYMFDAKIIYTYHANPYTHKALDFPGDDWIRFMRWVHRYSPYGPAWLGLSLIPTIFGFGKFITTLFAFKIFIALFHLLNCALIYKILSRLNYKNGPFFTALYSLNPTLLLEGIANSHNDILITSFLLLTIYLFFQNKKVFSVLSIFLAVAIKYFPVLNIPFLVYFLFRKKSSPRFLVLSFIAVMAIFTVLYSTIAISVPFVSSSGLQVQFQPWYLFWTIPLISLLPGFFWVAPAVVVSLSASLRYLPFVYFGEWSQPGVLTYMRLVTTIPFLVALAILVFPKIYFRK